jgi:SAM-dependent methyltransferase
MNESAEDRLPWDMVALLRDLARRADSLLDIGCGTAAKLREVAPVLRHLCALDCNAAWLTQAAANLRSWGVRNIHLVQGLSQRLPFGDEQFDLVTCLLAPHAVREIWRVLKPGGCVVLEKVGERDKGNIKDELGKDEHGWRGFLSDLEEGERARSLQLEFEALFPTVHIRTGSCRQVIHSLEQLIQLLEHFWIVRGFDRTRDAAILERFAKRFRTEGHIETRQQRILIQAWKAGPASGLRAL